MKKLSAKKTAKPIEKNDSSKGFQKDISDYKYSLFARRDSRGPIFLFDSNQTLIGRIQFVPDSSPPQLAYIDTSGAVVLSYRESEFPMLVDLLRNERKRYLIWVDSSNSRISTGS